MSVASVATMAGLVVLALSACGSIYALAATWTLWRFLRRPDYPAAIETDVTVLKALHGDEPGLYENLASLCVQDYGGPIQVIMGAREQADPALAVAEQIKRDYPDRDIALIADATQHGTNRKISNLINMLPQARGEIIIISDSDVRLPSDAVRKIVGALAQPGAGLVHCLYRGLPTGSVWSTLAAMDIDARFAAGVALGEALGAHPCLGPTMALRTEVLREVGGLPILADQLADDFVLGAAVRATGRRIVAPSMLIDHVFPERSLRDLIVHELRWARTIRLVQPVGYAGSLITHFLPLALVGAALTGFSRLGSESLLALAAVRLAQVFVLSRMMGSLRPRLWLAPVRDILS
ncbi:MAG TPA: bacteriohopanetetrol glucosamine biosynthesis glycosyltransferase HpnI, partial [Caulobacteraceae bacterium]|nr:bacteriohopanetetrol glucosamine biosynthesis glycosyltransferase HpnI [Caulobacteraceae bacterium]